LTPRLQRLSFVAALLMAVTPLTAHAQLEAAEQHFANARFEEALDALDAIDAGALDRADALVELDNDAAALDRALTRLARLSPEHRFPDEVPPDLVQALERARSANQAAPPPPESESTAPVATTEQSTPWYLEADEVEDEGSSPVPWIILGAGLVAAAITAIVLVFALQPSRDPNEPEDPSWELPPAFEEEL
jgi:hypothetical protein